MYLAHGKPILSISISDAKGKLIKIVQTNQNRVQIDLGYLPIGVYFVKIETNDGVLHKKVLRK
jgi:hypothetical protein